MLLGCGATHCHPWPWIPPIPGGMTRSFLRLALMGLNNYLTRGFGFIIMVAFLQCLTKFVSLIGQLMYFEDLILSFGNRSKYEFLK